MAQTRKKILVIIPAFNEEKSIAAVVGDVKRHVPEADIAVINDGSIDATAKIIDGLDVVALHHPYNLGIGATMQTGFKYAFLNKYDIAVQVDADGQHPADQISKVIKPVLENRAHLSVGSRFLGEGTYKPSIARGLGISIFSGIVSFIIGVRVTDTTSGFRASGRECIEFFASRYPDDYPEVEALVLLHRKGFSIIEVPVRMNERAGGVSSITPTKSVYYMIKVMLAIFVDLIKKV